MIITVSQPVFISSSTTFVYLQNNNAKPVQMIADGLPMLSEIWQPNSIFKIYKITIQTENSDLRKADGWGRAIQQRGMVERDSVVYVQYDLGQWVVDISRESTGSIKF